MIALKMNTQSHNFASHSFLSPKYRGLDLPLSVFLVLFTLSGVVLDVIRAYMCVAQLGLVMLGDGF